jgi:hypothetical protein
MEEDEVDAHHRAMVPLLTDDAIEAAVADFRLPLAPGVTLDWLSRAVRNALSSSRADVTSTSKRPSNRQVKANLTGAATAADTAFYALLQLDWWSDEALWRASLAGWDGEGGVDLGELGVVAPAAEYRRFKETIDNLEWLSAWLRLVSASLPSQRSPWRRQADRTLRINRGRQLAPVFEAAFGQQVSANNWPSDARHKHSTAFMDFYERMVAVAFNERSTPDLPGILKEVCQKHRATPAELVPKINLVRSGENRAV